MTVTLPTTKTKPTTDLAKQSILLYGVPKLGKSSFASSSRKPCSSNASQVSIT